MNVTFRIGTVLATGFRTWLKNFVPFVLLTALIHSPVVLWGISIIGGELTPEQMGRFTTFLGASFWLVVPLNLLASGLLAYGVIMELQGQRASFGACIMKGIARMFPSLGTTIAASLCIGGAMICVAIPFVFINQVLMTIVVGIAMLCFLSMLSVSATASALERSGMLAALGRSRALTRGHKFAIAILAILVIVIHFAVQILVATVMIAGSQRPSESRFTFYVYAALGLGVIVGSIGAVMTNVAYYFLRAEKEGTSAEELATVFG